MRLKFMAVCISIAALVLVACEEKVPIREFSKAKEAIDLALSVKADQYSPLEMKEANDQLVKAHSVFIKDEKPEDSVKNSEAAYNKAIEAYNKSAVLYAADAMKKADEAITAADKVYAEKLSPDLFSQAKELYNSSNEKFEKKDYVATSALADESYKKAVKAREESLDNKYQLQVKIDEVHSILSKVEKYDYEAYAAEKYNVASSKTAEAEKCYNSEALKEGFEKIETAKMNANEAYKATMEGITVKKIQEAENVVADAEKSKGASVAEEDLAAAKEALNNAKNMKNSGNYDESITYANEAIRLGNEVIESGKKSTVASVKDQGQADKDKSKDKDKDKAAGKTKKEFVSEDEDFYYYKVKSWEKYEDCLSRIAFQYYKNAKMWGRIHKANNIKNPDLIRPGWIIKVPKIKK